MRGRIPCNQGEVLCEDVYSECGELEDSEPVRVKCLAMECDLKTLDDQWKKVLRVDPHPSPKQSGTVFVTGTQTVNWVTLDSGVPYQASNSAFTLRGLKWHPFQPWAIAYEANIECLKEKKWRCYGSLVLSKDAGLTWSRILDNVK